MAGTTFLMEAVAFEVRKLLLINDALFLRAERRANASSRL